MHSKERWRKKRLVVFDLDGTLAPSKSPMDVEMSRLLSKLLVVKKVAVISGGRYGQFKKQFLKSLRVPRELLNRLFLFPTTSTSFYRHERGWKKVYSRELSARERKKIKSAFKEVFRKLSYKHPKKIYGPVVEDRGTQITFSAVGQRAPVHVKAKWNRDSDIRPRLMRALQNHISGFEIHRGGLTSIDVTRKGIDKAYGVRQIVRELKIPIKDMLFVGDALYPGGNDYAARRTGVEGVQVSGPAEAKRIIRFLIQNKSSGHSK